MTPNQYLQAERTAKEYKLELLGFYHSHPDHPAAPSEFDREHALPWFTYVIVSIRQAMARGMTAWELNEMRRFEEQQLLVEYSLTK